jgi:flotillin
VLDAKASGYRSLIESCRGDAKAASTLLMIEKIEEIVAMQVEAIRNLKIDKVTVWDSGGASGNGSSTANFAASLIKSLPPLHEVAGMAGIELPGYLGNILDGKEHKEKKPSAPKPPAPPVPPALPRQHRPTNQSPTR